MSEKWYKRISNEAENRYNRLAEQVTRRDAIVGISSFLGGAAATYAAMRIDREDAVDNGEKEREVQFATGIDLSWPQGTAEQYAGMRHDFVILGVNGGMPTTANPHLVDQLRVASQITQNADPSVTGMLPIQLYLNTANPADDYDNKDLVADWPASEDSDIAYNPYADEGVCDGTDSQACMYVYGWRRAKESVEKIFTEAAQQAGVSIDPVDYTWWLDVETYNSWREDPRDGEDAQESNVAVLEGMVAFIHSLGAGVGLYGARNHVKEIIGDKVKETSNLYHLPTWLAMGTTSEEEVKRTLADGTAEPFTGGGKVAIIQRVEGESANAPGALDYNYAVIPDAA